jgi:hypothetical protein
MPFVQFFAELALLILWSATATISWLLVRKNLTIRPGRDLRFLGTVLMILAVAAVWLFHASAVYALVVFLLGFALSVIGGIKSRSARRSSERLKT